MSALALQQLLDGKQRGGSKPNSSSASLATSHHTRQPRHPFENSRRPLLARITSTQAALALPQFRTPSPVSPTPSCDFISERTSSPRDKLRMADHGSTKPTSTSSVPSQPGTTTPSLPTRTVVPRSARPMMPPRTRTTAGTNAPERTRKALEGIRAFLASKSCYDILPESFRFVLSFSRCPSLS